MMEYFTNTGNGYPFNWLDEIVEVTLNPGKTNLKLITVVHLEEIRRQLPTEIRRIGVCIKAHAFSLYQTEQVRVIAGRYNLSVQLLYKRAGENLAGYPVSGRLRKTGEEILGHLSDLGEMIRERYKEVLPGMAEHLAEPGYPAPGDKVGLDISVDQLGILLRAAFDVHLVLGNSFRKVCKAVAPFLATPRRETISWDSIRSNSGRPEKRDKEIAVALLEKMIGKIKDYR